MARILILTHEFFPFRGGVGAVAHGLAAGALEAGHDPIVFAPGYGRDQRQADEDLPYRVLRFEGRTGSLVSTRKLTRFTLQCLRAIGRADADVVHAVDPAAHMALTMLRRLRAVHDYFFTVHGTELLRYRTEPFPRLWMTRAFRHVRGVAVVSDAVHRMLVEAFPEAGARAFVSHPGITSEWLHTPKRDRSVWRERRGVAEDDVVVITLARRVPEKGQDRVIDAIADLPQDDRARVVYVVAGEGPEAYARTLLAAAAARGVRLQLLGPATDAAAIEACDAADIFAMASRRTPKRIEGLGLAYLEAGARGLPSLATATGGVTEAVRDGETGIVTAEGADPSMLAAAIGRLVRDAQLRRRLGENARAFASGFTWRRHADEVYSRFLSMRESRRR